MILKGRTRADGGKLANYLLSAKNEQVLILDIRGTVIDDRTADGLKQSLGDMDELGKMTRAKSSLFHLAINPSEFDRLTREDWKYSVDKAEKALGLTGQPRAVVSHIYQGKEHLHVVWSRVDVENRKCVEMSFSNLKLCSAAREIEIELGLKQTPQRARGAHRLKQHVRDIQQHQDERAAQPRRERNAAIENAWRQSGNGREFKEHIERAGYRLAVGRRGILVMDANNEPHSISRCVKGIKAGDVKAKLADLRDLPTVEDLRKDAAPEPQRQRARHMTSRQFQREAANDNSPAEKLSPARGQAHRLTHDELAKRMADEEMKKRRQRAPGGA